MTQKKVTPETVKLSVLGERTYKNTHCKRTFALNDTKISHFPFLDTKNDYIRKDNIGFEVAGSKDALYFDAPNAKAGIVTCGGICPGLNNVIRSIVLCLWHNYSVRRIEGFQYGLRGFIAKYDHPVMSLTPETVTNIHGIGGTILGTSRGPQPPDEIIDTLVARKINQLYFIGGNGTLKAAHLIYKKIRQRGLKIAIISIPKTIDNDILYVSQSFGFNSAVEVATAAIRSAHVEAIASPNGIGLVKLMGRESGFIAATAAIAQRDVNFVLIPEVSLSLDSCHGFFQALKKRMLYKHHAVIVVAEGFGQNLLNASNEQTDGSGNVKLGDIGVYLKKKINEYFSDEGIEINLKYIDPSYLIRSVPSNTHDNLFSATLGQNAVHAAMAGFTDTLISWWHGVYCLIPTSLASSGTRKINPEGRLWLSVLESTGQDQFFDIRHSSQ